MNQPQDPLAAAFEAQRAEGEQAGQAAINTAREHRALAQDPAIHAGIEQAAAALPQHHWDAARLEELGHPPVPTYGSGATAPPPPQPQVHAPVASDAGHPQPQAPQAQTTLSATVQSVDLARNGHLGSEGSTVRILARIGVAGEPLVDIHVPLSTIFQRIPSADIEAMLSRGGAQVREFTWELRYPAPDGSYRKGGHKGSQPPAETRGLINGNTTQVWHLEDSHRTGPSEGVAIYRLVDTIHPKSPQEVAAENQARANAAAMAPLVAAQQMAPQPAPPGLPALTPESVSPFGNDPSPSYSPPPGEQVHNDNPWVR